MTSENRITCQLCYGQNGKHQKGCINYVEPLPSKECLTLEAAIEQRDLWAAQCNATSEREATLLRQFSRVAILVESLEAIAVHPSKRNELMIGASYTELALRTCAIARDALDQYKCLCQAGRPLLEVAAELKAMQPDETTTSHDSAGRLREDAPLDEYGKPL